MTRAQLSLLDHLGIDKLYACIGSSMGGMSSLSMAYLAPERVGRLASISASGRSGLGGVGMRYAQRSGECGLSLADRFKSVYINSQIRCYVKMCEGGQYQE